MTSWDALLVNTVAAFLVEPAHVRGEEEDRIALIRHAATRASIGTALMAALVGAAETLADAFADRMKPGGGAAWARACMDAGAAVSAVLSWRTAQLVTKLGEEGKF